VVYTRRDETGFGYNSYSIVDENGNGYDVTLNYQSDIFSFRKRSAWSASALGYIHTGSAPSLATWYTLRLNKMGSNFIVEVYEGKTLDFTSPIATVNGADSSYTSFDRVAVNGWYPFFTDEPTVRKLL